MPDIRVARRYALALIYLVEKLKQLDVVWKDLELILRTYKSSRDFQLFLESPLIREDKKKQILGELFKRRISATTMQFLELLAEKNREGILPDVIGQFHQLSNERLGIVEVVVMSAVELTKAQQHELERQLGQYAKKKVDVEYLVDPAVKGGFVVRIGDTVLDASIKRQLELLHEKFVSAAGVASFNSH
ncbi:MAG: ATP synthase F1 subunit delta [Bacteroidota bacterium]